MQYIAPNPISCEQAYDTVAHYEKVALSEESEQRVAACRKFLDDKIAEIDRPLYGITTGFGSLCDISISPDDLEKLQCNLMMSHACGVGERVPNDIVRLMLLLKARSLSYGNSGVQVETVQRLIDFYNEGVTPIVYNQGSLGASGDLAPLAHLCLPLIGMGAVEYNGQTRPAADVLDELGWKPLHMKSKEGLALLNGTQFMSAHGVWAVTRARRLADLANLVAAMSIDAFDGRIEPFGAEVNEVRNHAGQIHVAAKIRDLLTGSEIIAQPKKHVQDPYSFRCIPQVHGAVYDAIDFVEARLQEEINAPTDNPTIFPDDDIIVSAGNFHGEPIAMPMDYLALALTELSNISERRIYKLIGGTRGLPSFLVAKPGLNSGFMITQYTAASIVNQSKGLCWPTSCDSIPSSQGQEDHVSMGANSATKLISVLDNTMRVLGIELMVAAQALEFRRPLKSSPVVEEFFKAYRLAVPFVDTDTFMSPHLNKSIDYINACIS